MKGAFSLRTVNRVECIFVSAIKLHICDSHIRRSSWRYSGWMVVPLFSHYPMQLSELRVFEAGEVDVECWYAWRITVKTCVWRLIACWLQCSAVHLQQECASKVLYTGEGVADCRYRVENHSYWMWMSRRAICGVWRLTNVGCAVGNSSTSNRHIARRVNGAAGTLKYVDKSSVM